MFDQQCLRDDAAAGLRLLDPGPNSEFPDTGKRFPDTLIKFPVPILREFVSNLLI